MKNKRVLYYIFIVILVIGAITSTILSVLLYKNMIANSATAGTVFPFIGSVALVLIIVIILFSLFLKVLNSKGKNNG